MAAMMLSLECLFVFSQVGKNLVIPGGARTIDARGKLVMPGGDAGKHVNGSDYPEKFCSMVTHWPKGLWLILNL